MAKVLGYNLEPRCEGASEAERGELGTACLHAREHDEDVNLVDELVEIFAVGVILIVD